MARKTEERGGEGELAEIVHRNIRALLEVRRQFDRQRRGHERMIDHATAFVGSARFLVFSALLFGAWILLNVRLIPGLKPFDPYPFVMLAMFASVEAIFLSTFVLITQNRQAELAEKRADLDLQINLLSEHEVTRLIALVDAIAKRLGVEEARPAELSELKQDVKPEEVLAEIEHATEKPPEGEPH